VQVACAVNEGSRNCSIGVGRQVFEKAGNATLCPLAPYHAQGRTVPRRSQHAAFRHARPQTKRPVLSVLQTVEMSSTEKSPTCMLENGIRRNRPSRPVEYRVTTAPAARREKKYQASRPRDIRRQPSCPRRQVQWHMNHVGGG